MGKKNKMLEKKKMHEEIKKKNAKGPPATAIAIASN
jgi:hypothetical protein